MMLSICKWSNKYNWTENSSSVYKLTLWCKHVNMLQFLVCNIYVCISCRPPITYMKIVSLKRALVSGIFSWLWHRPEWLSEKRRIFQELLEAISILNTGNVPDVKSGLDGWLHSITLDALFIVFPLLLFLTGCRLSPDFSFCSECSCPLSNMGPEALF